MEDAPDDGRPVHVGPLGGAPIGPSGQADTRDVAFAAASGSATYTWNWR